MTSLTILSSNDSAVLGALFDPEASLSTGTQIDASLPQGFDPTELQSIQEEEREALLLINHAQCNDEDIRASVSGLSKIIDQHPQYASAWSNRAQATRMLFDAEQLANHIDELRSIMGDLAQAIFLATPPSPADSVSSQNARVLSAAHTHRGYLLWLASRSDGLSKAISALGEPWNGRSEGQLEEMASREFALGGRYGNDIARQLAVKTNPYAKLCGSIVREAMRKEIADYCQISVAKIQSN